MNATNPGTMTARNTRALATAVTTERTASKLASVRVTSALCIAPSCRYARRSVDTGRAMLALRALVARHPHLTAIYSL